MWLRIHRLEYENMLKYLSSQFWISLKIFANMRMYSAKWCNFSISQVTQELLNSLQIFFFPTKSLKVCEINSRFDSV